MRFAELDAVTLDAFGTLVGLKDPVLELQDALRARGVERDREAVAKAFAAEGEYYRPRSLEGRDEESLARLRRECVAVFLDALGADLAPAAFVETYIEALRFELLPGVRETIGSLRRRGLALAVVGNWDMALPGHLDTLGLGDLPVFTSAAVGAAKPDPAPFRRALEALGVEPSRALHVGDSEADELGAEAAGMRFAWAPLTSALASGA
ncbi:MAG TPA: HAD-IA family hydrolase [Gaiellaceae bacterium]|jgi:HAD superfamily hydrolase (TIGR01509 family)|nr:HAD-IA family hydrolase [Gaiellaceae bacterium]